MTVTEIQHKKENGDNQIVMKITGCSESILIQMLNGSRSIETPTGEKVIKAFEKIFSNRELLLKELKED